MSNQGYSFDAIADAKRQLGIDKLNISVQKCDKNGYTVKRNGENYTVEYGEKCDLMKALGLISMYKDEIVELHGEKRTKHLGYLVDSARNAVPTLDTLKRLMIRLASFGYDRLYMYVEDTMEIEGEPFFGHLRGRYSIDEMKEIDAYADALGISIVPCIQTLAHLNCMFKWPEYAQCNDTADILLIDCDRTYQLINNLFSTISHCFKGKHIHIGMDEAYLVGRGKHMDLYGYEEKHSLLKRHIEIIMNMARKYGFSAEIWSDMYFREAFGGGYYSIDKGLSEEICKEIPKNVGLVYWDYWNRDEAVIDNMFKRHLETGNEVIFAGGACKWSGWNPSTEMALILGRKMLQGCRKYGIDSIYLTAWSDDGAEASVFSTLPSIILYSLDAYGESTDDSAIDNLLRRYCGLSLEEYIRCDLNFFGDSVDESYIFGTLPKILLYNDPLSGFYDGIFKDYRLTEQIVKCGLEIKKMKDGCFGEERGMLDILALLCPVLEIKWNLGLRIRHAYQAGNKAALDVIANGDIPELISRLAAFKAEFYRHWIRENKSNGFGTHDLRLGGLAERLNTVKILVNSYISGEISEISELNEELLTVSDDARLDMLLWTTWKRIHTLYVL